MSPPFAMPASIAVAEPGLAQAVRFGDVVYSGAILSHDRYGTIAGGQDVVRQAEKAFANLAAVLAAAGAHAGDVARLNCYVDPSACDRIDELRQVRNRIFMPSALAGAEVPLILGQAGALFAVEAIAHVGAAKRLINLEPNKAGGWADAVRAGDTLYVSARYGKEGSFDKQAKGIYDAFDTILKAAGVPWSDVVRAHQYAASPALSMDGIRAARAPYLRNEEFLSTTVVCSSAGLAGIPSSWQLIVDIEAAIAPKTYGSAPTAWANPGGLHVVKSGGIGYFQPQMSRNVQNETLFPDDAAAHTEQICRNLDAMLAASGIERTNLVHTRIFCKHQRDVPAAREVFERWVGKSGCARSELVVDFFDPLAIVEIEVTASV